MNAPEKALIPSLRFPEFSGAWEEKRLGELAIFASGGTPSKKKDEYWSGHIPWISASSMHSDVIDRSELMVTDLGAQNGTKLAATGALLLLVRGSMLFNRIPAGICARDVVFNQDVKLLIASPETTEHFILLQIRSKEHRLLSLVVGTGIGAGKIDTSELEIFSMPIPPLPEQQKIADYLGAVDAKLRLLERRRDTLTAYKKGMMQRIFVQEIRFTQEDGTAFPDWQEKRLGEVVSEKFSNGVFNDPKLVGSGYRIINVREMYDGDTIALEGLSRVDISEREFIKNRARKGDIFFTRSSLVKEGIAHSNILIDYADDVTFDGHLIRMRLDNKICIPNFFAIHLHSDHVRRQLVARGKTGTMTTIGQEDISTVSVFLPHPDEQQKIADFLSAIDDKITAAARQISAMQDFKKSMLQQMFV